MKLLIQVLHGVDTKKNSLFTFFGIAAYTHVQNDAYGEMILAVSRILLDTRFSQDDHPVDDVLQMIFVSWLFLKLYITECRCGLLVRLLLMLFLWF